MWSYIKFPSALIHRHLNFYFTAPSLPDLGPHLIQGGLGHRVVFHAQPLPLAGELCENVGQGSRRVRELILQRVVMLLLQNAAWERLLDKILDWLQLRGRAAHPDDHRVAVAKPVRGKMESSSESKTTSPHSYNNHTAISSQVNPQHGDVPVSGWCWHPWEVVQERWHNRVISCDRNSISKKDRSAVSKRPDANQRLIELRNWVLRLQSTLFKFYYYYLLLLRHVPHIYEPWEDMSKSSLL